MKDILSKVSVWGLKQAYLNQLKVFITSSGEHSNIELVKRLERAYEILTRDDRYEMTYNKSRKRFLVTSPHDEYIIDHPAGTCSCPDAARNILCKHRLAVKLCLDAVKIDKEK